MEHSDIVRVLIHAETQPRLLDEVTGILESAVETHPATFTKVMGQPSIEDHYGFQTHVLSSVVLTREPWGPHFYRLTIRPGAHIVFDNLAALIADRLTAKVS